MEKRVFSKAFLSKADWIVSMANSWKSVRQELQGHLYVMFQHLVKVYYYHNWRQYLRGWIDSIHKGFDQVKKLSNTNKWPNEEQMFQFIWNEWLDGEVDNLQNKIIRELNNFYKDVPPIKEPDYEGFRDFALKYCRLLSKKIAEQGGITTDEISDFVDDYFWNN